MNFWTEKFWFELTKTKRTVFPVDIGILYSNKCNKKQSSNTAIKNQINQYLLIQTVAV